MTLVVTFAGPAKVGKSTSAKTIEKLIKIYYPEINVGCFAFADPLYEICSLLLNIPIETLMSQEYKDVPWTNESTPLPGLVGWTPRKFLQKVGTEGFRQQIYNEFWVDCAINRAKGFDIALFGDGRFENEFIKSDYVIELSRDGVEYAMDHPSAMPPAKELVDEKYFLSKNCEFSTLVDKLIEMSKQKEEKDATMGCI